MIRFSTGCKGPFFGWVIGGKLLFADVFDSQRILFRCYQYMTFIGNVRKLLKGINFIKHYLEISD